MAAHARLLRTAPATSSAPSALQVRIGTLSLPGASPAQAARIGDAMRRELATLLASTGGSGIGESRHRSRLDGGSMMLSPTDRPEVIGRRLAQAIARSLRQAGGDGTSGDES